VGDFNADGIPDLAVSVFGQSTQPAARLCWQCSSERETDFRPRVDYSTGCGPSAPAIADFNGDGKQDLVTGDAVDGTLSVFLEMAMERSNRA